MKPNDGGPAFPVLEDMEFDSGHRLVLTAYGMTLRDWFAGQALAGLCANPAWTETLWRQVAVDAYCAADDMLTERAKPLDTPPGK